MKSPPPLELNNLYYETSVTQKLGSPLPTDFFYTYEQDSNS